MATESNPQIKYEVAQRIKELMQERGMNQEQLAAAARIDPGVLSNRLRGNNELTVPNLLAIARALHVHPMDLIPDSIIGDGNPPPPGEIPLRREGLVGMLVG